jgi:hypothetical protein
MITGDAPVLGEFLNRTETRASQTEALAEHFNQRTPDAPVWRRRSLILRPVRSIWA